MLVRNILTGEFLDLRGDFRPAMTARARVASFHDPKVAGLVSTVPGVFGEVLRRFGLEASTVELVRSDSDF